MGVNFFKKFPQKQTSFSASELNMFDQDIETLRRNSEKKLWEETLRKRETLRRHRQTILRMIPFMDILRSQRDHLALPPRIAESTSRITGTQRNTETVARDSKTNSATNQAKLAIEGL